MAIQASSGKASKKLVVNLVLPRETLETCFAASDVALLRERCDLRNTPPERVTTEAVGELGAGADVWITGWGTPQLPPQAFDRAPGLKLIAHSAGTTRALLPQDFWTRGIGLTTVNGALAVGVAEVQLGLLIVCSKRMWQIRDQSRQKKVWRDPVQVAQMKELYGTTLGIASASRVGRHFIKLTECLDVTRLLYDPYVTAEQARAMGVEKVDSLLEMARRSDYLVVCTPDLPETKHMVSREVLQALPDDCILINCARGAVIDEPALIAELEKGRLFACLDVTDPEPPKRDNPLWTLPNVVLSPHISGHSNNARARQGRFLVSEILRFSEGQPLEWGVTEKQWRIMG